MRVYNGSVKNIHTAVGHMICVHSIEHRMHVCWVPWRTEVHWWSSSYCETAVEILSVFAKEDKLVKRVIGTLETQILTFQYLHTEKYEVRRVGTVAVIVWKCVIFHLESSALGKAYLCSCQVTFKKTWKVLNFSHDTFPSEFAWCSEEPLCPFQKQDLFIVSVQVYAENIVKSSSNVVLAEMTF
jgi:hypothetical protein